MWAAGDRRAHLPARLPPGAALFAPGWQSARRCPPLPEGPSVGHRRILDRRGDPTRDGDLQGRPVPIRHRGPLARDTRRRDGYGVSPSGEVSDGVRGVSLDDDHHEVPRAGQAGSVRASTQPSPPSGNSSCPALGPPGESQSRAGEDGGRQPRIASPRTRTRPAPSRFGHDAADATAAGRRNAGAQTQATFARRRAGAAGDASSGSLKRPHSFSPEHYHRHRVGVS